MKKAAVIAGSALFEGARHVTGESVFADGGMRAAAPR